MNFLYTDFNYIIHSSNATGVTEPIAEYSAKNSIYVETPTAFTLKEVNATGGGTIVINKSDLAEWENAEVGGLPYTEQSMRSFLRQKTAKMLP